MIGTETAGRVPRPRFDYEVRGSGPEKTQWVIERWNGHVTEYGPYKSALSAKKLIERRKAAIAKAEGRSDG